MIEKLTAAFPMDTIGGFVAYWNDNPLYPSDPMAMFRKSLGVMITAKEQVYVCPVDLTVEELDLTKAMFYPLEKHLFGSRSTGALFYKGCYFSIREGDYAGAYQISDDMLKTDRFPNAKAYTRFLLKD